MPPATPTHLFASSTAEEVRLLRADEVRVVEQRLEHGRAMSRWSNGWRIEATDVLRERVPDHLQLTEEDVAWLTAVATQRTEARPVRNEFLVTTTARRRVVVNESGAFRAEDHVSTVRHGQSVVTCAGSELGALLARLQQERGEPHLPTPSLPLVFTNGSGAVLLHECIGHASEEGIFTPSLPFAVFDAPAAVDDIGCSPQPADLRTSAPLGWRRWSFRDVPLRRMTSLVIDAAPAAERPDRYIDVDEVEEGTFDSLSGTATLLVRSAAEVTPSGRTTLIPFELTVSRDSLWQRLSIAGTAAVERTVICSARGQRAPVHSSCPDLLLRSPR